jgi:hypothetical protein
VPATVRASAVVPARPVTSASRRQRRLKPQLNPLIGSSYKEPVVTSGPLAAFATTALSNAAGAPAGLASRSLASTASSSARSLSPVRPAAQVVDTTPVLPTSLQLFWAKNPDTCPLRSAQSFVSSKLLGPGDASRSALLPAGLTGSLGITGMPLDDALGGNTISRPLDRTLIAERELPTGQAAPAVMPAYLVTALENHFSVGLPVDLYGGSGGVPMAGGAFIASLDALRSAQRHHAAAARVQAAFRMWYDRARFKLVKRVVVSLQRWSRMHLARFLLAKMREAKQQVAADTVTLAVQLSIMLPIGQHWRGFRQHRRIIRIVAAWHRWAVVKRRGFDAQCAYIRYAIEGIYRLQLL